MRRLLLALLALTAASPAVADDTLNVVALRAGTSSFHGDLSKDQNAPTYGLVWQIIREPALEAQIYPDWWLSRTLRGVALVPQISVTNIDARTKASLDFPFAPDHATHLTAIDFGWRFCGLTSASIHPCLIAMIGDLSVEQGDRYAQRYGAGAFGLSVESFVTRQIYVSLDAEWRDVSQTVAKETASFDVRSQTLGLGWVF